MGKEEVFLPVRTECPFAGWKAFMSNRNFEASGGCLRVLFWHDIRGESRSIYHPLTNLLV